MTPNNVLITGIPRSGTTLLTAMLDALPDAVALSEPLWQAEWVLRQGSGSAPEDFLRWLREDVAALRRALTAGNAVMDKRSADGAALTNYFHRESGGSGYVPFARAGLTPDFLLAIKHNAQFLSVLPQLAACADFRVMAILRHPVGAIASWRQVPIPLREGRLPGAMAYWPEMRALTESGLPLLEKQARIYDLMCDRLHALRGRILLLRYEELMKEPGLAYRLLGMKPPARAVPVTPREAGFYGPETHMIRDAVLRFAPSAKHFYSERELAQD